MFSSMKFIVSKYKASAQQKKPPTKQKDKQPKGEDLQMTAPTKG